jgi:hypothetical protein
VTVKAIARLSRQDLGILAEAAVLLLVVEVTLRLRPLDAVTARLSSVAWPLATLDEKGQRRAAALVDRLGRLYPLQATCLKRSLVLLRILRRRGSPAELRLGVRTADGEFSSHAWIECAGQLLLDEGRAGEFALLALPGQTAGHLRHTSI